MGYYYCDTLGAGTGAGTEANPFLSLETALEYNAYTADDTLIISRRSSFASASSNIQPNVASDGTVKQWINIWRWPLAEESGTATFTQGSKVVSGVGTITPDFNQHATRRIKCDADGKWYMINAIVYKIDYDGESGAFTEGLIVTASGGATGRIHRVVDNGDTGSLYVVVKSGTFGDDETITDTATGSATVNGDAAIDGFLIRRRYAGTTASSAACTIEEDDHYDECQAIDDTGWPAGRKKTDWDADAKQFIDINFEATAYCLYMTGSYMWRFVGIKLIGGSGSNGSLYSRAVSNLAFEHCVLEQDQNAGQCGFNSDQNHDSPRVFFDYCVFMGSGTGSSQSGPGGGGGGEIHYRECSIYNYGDYGLNQAGAMVYAEGMDIGVVLPNGDEDVVAGAYDWFWTDVELDGSNGFVISGIFYRGSLNIQNYNGVLGAFHSWHANGEIYSVDVVAGSGDPQKRTGGSDTVIALTMNQADTSRGYLYDYAGIKITHPYQPILVWADTSAHTYRIYVQANGLSISSASEFYLRAKYTDTYNSPSNYHRAYIQSDETISARSDASDWSQYIEVTVQSAVAGWVELEIIAGFYDSDGILYIDPLPVVS